MSKNFNEKILKNRNIRHLSLLLIIFILISTIIPIPNAKSIQNFQLINVVISKDGNFTTIQEGIDFSKPGDIIYVKNGTYYENLIIEKSISLIGENNTSTIIDGRKSGNVIKIKSDNVIIKGFTIQHSGIYFPNSGINSSSNNNVIEKNIIKNNFYGMTLFKSSNNMIIGNIIHDNINCGIFMSKSSTNSISSNKIHDHTYNGIGIYDSSNNNTIKNNKLMHNGYCAINIRISSNNIIIDNNITKNNIGIHLPESNNIVEKNNLTNNNKNIEKELDTPGFEIIFLILSIISIIFWKKKNNIK